MAREEIIARRYARGLAESARDNNRVDEVRGDLRFLADVFDSRGGEAYVPEFAEFLDSPSVGVDDKRAVIDKICEKTGVGEMASAFLGVLVQSRRVGLLPKIARAFVEISGEMSGELAAVVQTARQLTGDQEIRLAEALATAFGKKVRLHQQVEPSLLAGVKVTVGDKVFDGSVLGRLERLKNSLAYSRNDGEEE